MLHINYLFVVYHISYIIYCTLHSTHDIYIYILCIICTTGHTLYVYIQCDIYIYRERERDFVKNTPYPWAAFCLSLPVSFWYSSGKQVFLHLFTECPLTGDLAPFRYPSGILPVCFWYAGVLTHLYGKSLEPPPSTTWMGGERAERAERGRSSVS